MPNDIDTSLHPKDDCAPCGLHQPVRNAYYDGKMLTARDLDAEQTYMNGMRHLGNMMLEGKGTICGLKVVMHPEPGCRHSHLVLKAGIALSCCGQEIVVPKDVTIPVLEMLNADPDLQEALSEAKNELMVELCRDDKAIEMGPVLISDCCSGMNGQMPNRIAEDFGFRLRAVAPGSQSPTRTVLKPDLAWVHSLNQGDELPKAVAIDEENDLVFVGAQTVSDGDSSTASVRAYSMTTHSHLLTLMGWETVTDIAAPAVGGFMFVAGQREGRSVIAAYTRNPVHNAEPEHLQQLGGPAQLAFSPISGALFSLEYNDSQQPRVRGWSAEQIAAGFSDESFNRTKLQSMNTSSMDAGCRVIEVSPDGQKLALSLPDVTPGTLRMGDVSEVLAGSLTLDDLEVTVLDELGEDVTQDYARTSSIRFAFDGQVLHCTGQDPDTPEQAFYRAVSLTESGAVQLGGGMRFEFPTDTARVALFVAPDERWIYVSTATDLAAGTGVETGRVWAYEASVGQAPGTESVEGNAISTIPLNAEIGGGAIRLRGQRLYVPGIQALATDGDAGPIAGRVMVVDITEADIAGMFEECVEGCPACGEEDCCCVTLAQLVGYQWRAEDPMMMVDLGTGATENDAEIDNLTYRHIVPSNAKLMEAILEIAARGIDAGPPGPRGRDGSSGSNGASIDAVSYQPIAAPEVVPIGGIGPDLELRLPLPETGDRGGSIEQVGYDTTIDAPQTTPIAGDPEGDLALRLPIPIDDVVYRNVPSPRMGTAAGEERTLILPQPVAGGGTSPRDPQDYHFVEKTNWVAGEMFSMGGLGPQPPAFMEVILNMPVLTPVRCFTSIGAMTGAPKSLEFFSGVLDIRVHLHDRDYQIDGGTWQRFSVNNAKSLRYSPKFEGMEQGLLGAQTFMLDMQDLWVGIQEYWQKNDAMSNSRARIEIVLHGHMLDNEKGFPFDGRAEPTPPIELAGETGGTWRSWIDVTSI